MKTLKVELCARVLDDGLIDIDVHSPETDAFDLREFGSVFGRLVASLTQAFEEMTSMMPAEQEVPRDHRVDGRGSP